MEGQLEAPRPEQSKSGIASFAVAVGFPLLLLVFFALLFGSQILKEHGYLSFENETGDEVLLILAMLGAVGGPVVHLAGFGLGMAGVFRKQRKRFLAICGLAINGVMLILIATVWVLFFTWLIKSMAWH